MLTPEQINNIHRLHWVEKQSVRKIARQLHLGRRTIAKYLITPAPPPVHRDRASKLDPFKPAIAELLEQDSTVSVALIEQRLRAQGFDGGMTIVKDYVRTLRKSTAARRAYVRMEPAPGDRFDIDWGHFGALDYAGTPRKLYAFCLVECHSRKLYVAAGLLLFSMLLGYFGAQRKLGSLLPVAPFVGCAFLGYVSFQQTRDVIQTLTSGLRACSEQLPEGQPDNAPAVKNTLSRALDLRRSINAAYDRQTRDIEAIMNER